MQKFDDALLERFINGFYGYGNLDAPYWFIGMEEGGGDSFNEVNNRLDVWQTHNEPTTEDLVDFHRLIGVDRYFSTKSKLQSTWSKLIRVLHVLEGKPLITDAIRKTQQSDFGRIRGTSALLELMPLPSPSTTHWLYGDYSNLPYLSSRDIYQDKILPKRVKKLAELTKQHKPSAVMFYGLTYLDHWQAISGAQFETQQIGKFRAMYSKIGTTVFVATPHPVSTGITNDFFNQVGQLILAN